MSATGILDSVAHLAAYGASAFGSKDTAEKANYAEVAADLVAKAASDEGLTVGEVAGGAVDALTTNALMDRGMNQVAASAIGDAAAWLTEKAVDWIKEKVFGDDTADKKFDDPEVQAKLEEEKKNDGPGLGTAALAAAAVAVGAHFLGGKDEEKAAGQDGAEPGFLERALAWVEEKLGIRDEPPQSAAEAATPPVPEDLSREATGLVPPEFAATPAQNDVEIGDLKPRSGADFEREPEESRGRAG